MTIQVEHARKMLVEAERELGEAKERVQELQVLMKFLHRQLEQNAATTSPLARVPSLDGDERPRSYAEITLPEAIYDVLQRAGGALHLKEICARIKLGGRRVTKNFGTIVTSTASRRDDLFVKTARATYALRNGAEPPG